MNTLPDTDRTVVIVGDGPTGLSAALLLAKNDFETHVVGANETATLRAHLHNYLGLDGVPGPAFIERARDHAQKYGAKLHEGEVAAVDLGDPFRVRTGDGATFEGHYLVLATGFAKGVAGEMGLESGELGLRVDPDGRTSRDRVYAGGALTRGMKSHVATSVGDGAAIATDILSRVAGKPTHDYDVLQAS